MNFATRNDRASARMRYLTARPFTEETEITATERQMIRWQYSGLLVGELEMQEAVIWAGRVLPGDTWAGRSV